MTSGLNPVELAPISPLAATVLGEVFDTHPTLAHLQSVAVAVLAVIARYEFELRCSETTATALDAAAVRRAFIYLENTERPLAVHPTATASSLVAQARAEVAATNEQDSLAAFDVAVATLVRAARTRSRTKRS